jgi:ATP-binding cassette subfamily C protein LapB
MARAARHADSLSIDSPMQPARAANALTTQPEGDPSEATESQVPVPAGVGAALPAAPAATAPAQWPVGRESPSDALLGCLLAVAKLYERPTSAEALTAGLPVPESGLDPDLFIRAAERIDLSAGLVRRKLDEIPELVLPCVLLLKDRQACVLVRRLANDRFEVVFPETARGGAQLARAELEARYLGHALFVRPMVAAVARDYEEPDAAPRHWFWGTIGRFWRTYIQVALAAAFINMFALATPIFTMNVYDRVVPNLAVETLWVLAIGIVIVYAFDFTIRTLRGYFIDAAGRSADVLLARYNKNKADGTTLNPSKASTG